MSKRELNAELHKIDSRLIGIEQQHKAILDRLPVHRHWSRISRDLERRRRAARSKAPPR